MKKNIIGLLFVFTVGHIGAEQIENGLWRGGVNVAGQKIAVDLEVDGKNGFFSIPQQGILRVPVQQASLRQNKVSFRIPLPQGELRFQGTEEEQKISGIFLQAGMSGDFFLDYTGPAIPAAETVAAPGLDREITLSRGAVKLHGRIRDLPRDRDGGNLAALIIAGSGPTDGDGNSAIIGVKNNSLLHLANTLAEEGIPSLRFDKRGSGKSTEGYGSEADTLFTDLIADAGSWYTLLQQEYPGRGYVLIGHSQGSLVALDLASRRGAGAVVSLAGAGFSIGTTLKTQMDAFPPALRDAGIAILDELINGRKVETVPQPLLPLFRPLVQPFMISYLSYDPAVIITTVECPVLIVQGGRDSQVGPQEGENLHRARPDAEYLFIPNLNHLLRDVTDELENQRSYAEDRLPLSPDLQQGLTRFFKGLD